VKADGKGTLLSPVGGGWSYILSVAPGMRVSVGLRNVGVLHVIIASRWRDDVPLRAGPRRPRSVGDRSTKGETM